MTDWKNIARQMAIAVAWICRFEWADQDLDAGADTRVGEGDELR